MDLYDDPWKQLYLFYLLYYCFRSWAHFDREVENALTLTSAFAFGLFHFLNVISIGLFVLNVYPVKGWIVCLCTMVFLSLYLEYEQTEWHPDKPKAAQVVAFLLRIIWVAPAWYPAYKLSFG